MANIKSQIKRIKTNEKAHERNKAVKSSLKTAVRKFREAAEAGKKDKLTDLLQDASRKLDKAVSKGVIHANQAANRKSAMAKRANQALTASKSTSKPASKSTSKAASKSTGKAASRSTSKAKSS